MYKLPVKTLFIIFGTVFVIIGGWSAVNFISCDPKSGFLADHCFQSLSHTRNDAQHVKLIAIDESNGHVFTQTNFSDNGLSTSKSIIDIWNLDEPYEKIFSIEIPELVFSVDLHECCFSINSDDKRRVYDAESLELIREVDGIGSGILGNTRELFVATQLSPIVKVYDFRSDETQEVRSDVRLWVHSIYYETTLAQLVQNQKAFKACVEYDSVTEISYRLQDYTGWYMADGESTILELSACQILFKTNDIERHRGIPQISPNYKYALFWDGPVINLQTGEETEVGIFYLESYVTDDGSIWVSDWDKISVLTPMGVN